MIKRINPAGIRTQRRRRRQVLPLRVRRAIGAAVMALSVGALAACSAPSVTSPQPQAVPSDGATTTPDNAEPKSAASPKPSTASPKPSSAPDPKAATTVKPVDRRETAPKKRIEARVVGFRSKVAWSDGVNLVVRRVEHRTSAAVGPGATTGAPVTSFTVRLDNGSSRALDATAIVATATYGGKARRLASAVYDDRSADFAVRLAPGKSADATYSFSIPPSSFDAVELSFDLDSRHGVGTFKGPAR